MDVTLGLITGDIHGLTLMLHPGIPPVINPNVTSGYITCS
jgi:hypothetical protein